MDVKPIMRRYLDLGFQFSYAGVLTTGIAKQCAWLCPLVFFSEKCAPVIWPKCPRGHMGGTQALNPAFTVEKKHSKKCKFSLTFSFGRRRVWLPAQPLGVEKLAVECRLLPILSMGSFGTQCRTVRSILGSGGLTLHPVMQLFPVHKSFRRRFKS